MQHVGIVSLFTSSTTPTLTKRHESRGHRGETIHASPDAFEAFSSPAVRTLHASSSTLVARTPYASTLGPLGVAAATTPDHATHWLSDPTLAPDTTPEAVAAAVASGFLLLPTFDDRGTIPEPPVRTYGARGVTYGPPASTTPQILN